MEINLSLLLSQMVTFLIALSIVWKFGWGPITKLIQTRQDNIKQELLNAEQTRQAVTKLEDDYKHRLQLIDQQSKELLNLARLEGNRIRDEILNTTKKEVSDMRRRALEQINIERDVIVRDLRKKIIDLTMTLTTKVINNSDLDQFSEIKLQELIYKLEDEKVLTRAN
jgi:F-type H+-transporting ATPase subunit b